MRITFRKHPGCPSLGILFFWSLEVSAGQPSTLMDLFISELYFDYFYIRRGHMVAEDAARGLAVSVPQQALRGLLTRPFHFQYSTPLVLFGARLTLSFAEWYWAPRLNANAFTKQAWVRKPPGDLAAFAAQVITYVQAHRAPKFPYPLLGPNLEESGWLKSYSPRHKRRLYSSVFGVSRQALDRVRGLHAFLAQACAFEAGPPRIVGHVNPDVYYDQPHFNRAFKRLTGLTPVTYFVAQSQLQDNLMAASYNAAASEGAKL